MITKFIPRLVFWEITEKCNLNCPYCRRNDCSGKGLPLELSLQIIDRIAKDYRPLLVFSGGEPLLYPHIFEVCLYAYNKGLKTALATNATLIDEDLARKIKAMNFHRVAVSLDGARKETHESLRGARTFKKAIAGIQYLRRENTELQVNTTVTRTNFREMQQIYHLCLELGVTALHIFAFVPVGCGITVPQEERLSAQEYERFLKDVADLSSGAKIEIKITCAPHYNRILMEKSKDLPLSVSSGCLAGSGVCFISSAGEIYPCGYLAISAGNIFKQAFKETWEQSLLFNILRNTTNLKGRCGICEYQKVCAGCRARAFANSGDYLEEEPDCIYQPLNVKS